MEGRGPRRSSSFSGVVGQLPGLSRTTIKDLGKDGEEEEENSVEKEESYGTEGVLALVGESQGTGGPTLAQSDQPVSHPSETFLLAIMQQMTQIMANFQAASVAESSGLHLQRHQNALMGLRPSKSEASFSLVN
ncbi:hypothetical protein O181_074760 [Austropuccinia psidii MF-1]|uniref:Uncharacterized protein n=1 Tax=Austropuccinia psidii MF-1 TaxID=1389203 RepID=A0A9Q3IDB5_9BASI|nr:hypothetical protein [Austropuccinia psidii MF-1]